jgi:putative addiction module antidote
MGKLETRRVTKIASVGTSGGLVLPKDILSRYKLEKGDQVHLIETPLGILVSPFDPAVAEQIEAGKAFMRDYRDTFKALS